jgi:hypothetical protein
VSSADAGQLDVEPCRCIDLEPSADLDAHCLDTPSVCVCDLYARAFFFLFRAIAFFPMSNNDLQRPVAEVKSRDSESQQEID